MARIDRIAPLSAISGSSSEYSGNVYVERYSHTFSSAPSVGDILEFAPIPPSARVVDFIFDTDILDADASPLISFDLGIMSGAWSDNDPDRTVGAEFFSGSTIARTGGIVRPSAISAFRGASASYDRAIGLKIAAAAATFQSGTVGLTLLFAYE